MIGHFIAFLKQLRVDISPGCNHTNQVSIDESGDGSQIEWKCMKCDYTRIEERDLNSRDVPDFEPQKAGMEL